MRSQFMTPLWVSLLLAVLATADAGAVHHQAHRRLRSRRHRHSQTAGLQEPELPIGSVVLVRGLQSAVELNGQEAVVDSFDGTLGRYVLKMVATGAYKKVTPEHLTSVPFSPAGSATPSLQQDLRPPSEWPALAGGERGHPGVWVVLEGLAHDQALNGQTAVLNSFDKMTGRFTVTLGGKGAKRIKPANLRLSKERSGPQAQGGSTPLCHSKRAKDSGPGGFSPGAQVLLHGLSSAAAAGLNGKLVVVHCFDTVSNRYVVEMPDGTPREIKPQNLGLQDAPSTHAADPLALGGYQAPVAVEVTDEAGASEEDGEKEVGRSIRPGSRALLVSLKAAALNGKVVKVISFDDATKRWVVQMPDGTRRKVEADKLDLSDKVPPPRLTFCNAYGRNQQLQVSALADGGRPEDGKILDTLDFQTCTDLEERPFDKGTFSFLVGSKEVARAAFDAAALGENRGKEITVLRAKKDSAEEAVLHENVIELNDGDAYYLHLINAYSGSRKTQLSVQRGPVAKVLQLDKSYRMEKLEDISVTLADGHRRLKLAFKPEKSRTYCVVVTGGDAADKEADTAGLVLHEIGAWTSAEELADQV